MKNFLARLWVMLNQPFTAPTIDEIRAQQLQQAHLELMQSQHVIRSHRFQEHMTKAKIKALHSWETIEKALGEKNED